MSSAHSSVGSLKRKEVPSDNFGHTIVLPAPTLIGPTFVNFPAIRPAHSTVFKVYRRDQLRSTEDSPVDQQSVIACETHDVEYYSINKDLADRANEQFSCEYLPVIYDPSNGKMVIQPAIPTYVLAQRVKRTKVSDMLCNSALTSGIPNLTKRDQLGETFGTRKAKSRIRANERNKVDASAQESAREHLMQHIDDAVVSMPQNVTDPHTGSVSISPLIPRPNLITSDPSKVYPLDSLIPQDEASAIDVKPLLDNRLSDRERMNMLPFCSSRWIEAKMRVASELSLKDQEQTLRALYYVSCMRQFQKMKGALGNPSSLPEKMNHMPMVILNGLVERFTERAKGSSRPVITPAMENKLMAYQFAIRLAVENWVADIEATASDYQLTPHRVADIYKSLGCTVDKVSISDRERLGIKSGQASSMRKAILQAPPVFPKERKRGPAQR